MEETIFVVNRQFMENIMIHFLSDNKHHMFYNSFYVAILIFQLRTQIYFWIFINL